MAIWQFQLYLIPKRGLLNKYKLIPEKLYIDQESWSKYFEESNLDEDYSFEDALTTNWWKNLNILANDLFPILANIAAAQKPILGLQHFGNADTNNISVCCNEDSNEIEELSCRLDLREIDKEFINNIFAFATKFGCLLMDKKGKLIEPKIDELHNLIKTSNSYRFVNNPEKFLNDLSDGSIKLE